MTLAFTIEERRLLDLGIKHGLTENDAYKQLRALYSQGNYGPYTAVIRSILDAEGVIYDNRR